MSHAIDQLKQKRHILYMDTNIQLAISRLHPTEIVEWETHETQDQFIRVERGTLTVEFQRERTVTRQLIADAMDTIIIPANTKHRLSNLQSSIVSFYTVYTPPAHTLEEKESDDRDANQTR
jgi:mannose-6-phosphate isomerase-like protein (cupin superfamily)